MCQKRLQISDSELNVILIYTFHFHLVPPRAFTYAYILPYIGHIKNDLIILMPKSLSFSQRFLYILKKRKMEKEENQYILNIFPTSILLNKTI